jgi:hypothetical protein
MARVRAEESAERRAARLEDGRLRARRPRSTASGLRRSQQNERNRPRMAEGRQRETAEQAPDQVYPYGCNNLGPRPISVNAILGHQQKTDD